IEAFLRGLVVVGRNGEDAGDIEFLKLGDQVNDFLRVVAASAGEHGDAAARLFYGDLHYAQMLVVRERRTLAGRAAGAQEVDPGINLAPDEDAQGFFVQRAVCPEGSD